MARTTTATFDTANASAQKKPVILADFNGVTRRYSSQTFGDISANEKKLLRHLRMNLGNIDILNHSSEIEETEIEVLDEALDVTTQLTNSDFEGRDLTIKLGFQSLDEADFVTLPTQKVRAVRFGGEFLSWFFVARDTKLNLREDIFRSMPQTTLTQDESSSATTINVATGDADNFIDPSELPSAVRAGLVINNEVIRYTAKPTAQQFGTLTRGVGATTAAGHNDGDLVTQCLIFNQVDPLTAALFILMTTDDGSGHAYYDLNQHLTTPQITGIGLGLTASEVDVLTIELAAVKHFERGVEAGANLIAWKIAKANAWLKSNIWEPCAAYPYINDNKIAVQVFSLIEFVENYSAVATLDQDDIVSAEMTMDLDDLLNTIEIQYDIHPISGQVLNRQSYKMDDSVTSYGANQIPLIVRHPNIPSGTNSDFIADAILRRWFYLFGNQIGRWNITTRMENFVEPEPNDDLSLSYNQFVDLTAGTRGWSAKKGKVLSEEIELLDTDPIFRMQGFTWEMFDRVSSIYTSHGAITSAIDDSDVAFNSDNSVTLNTEDGYADPIDSEIVQMAMFSIDVVQPGVGSPTQAWHTISLGFHIQSTPGSVDARVDNRRYIHYDPSSSATLNFKFLLTMNTESSDSGWRYKVDWYEATASGGSGERPSSITFSALDRYRFLADISEV